MKSQADKHLAFRELPRTVRGIRHPNPWDAGSARILTALGFEALATTSAGFAFAIGRKDSSASLSRDAILENARCIVDATDLPASADLEDGFGADPADCAQTIALASQVGLVGGSIEDATGDPANPIFDFQLAVERVAAAAEEARLHPFLLTARAENFLHARPDLNDTVRRLQAFEKAGADVLYAPGLPNLDAIRLVCASVNRPVNVVMGLGGPTYSVDELKAVGVKRISVGGSQTRPIVGEMASLTQRTQVRCVVVGDVVIEVGTCENDVDVSGLHFDRQFFRDGKVGSKAPPPCIAPSLGIVIVPASVGELADEPFMGTLALLAAAAGAAKADRR